MKLKFIFAAIVFQILAVLSMLAYAYAPIYFGEEIVVRTSLYDPRDIFRGNYVRLSYDFSRVYGEKFSGEDGRAQGNKIYAILKRGEDGIYKLDKFSLERPNGGVFLAGWKDYYGDAKFGIEAFFMPPDKALQMERDLRDADANATAVISVMSNGKARIKEIVLGR